MCRLLLSRPANKTSKSNRKARPPRAMDFAKKNEDNRLPGRVFGKLRSDFRIREIVVGFPQEARKIGRISLVRHS